MSVEELREHCKWRIFEGEDPYQVEKDVRNDESLNKEEKERILLWTHEYAAHYEKYEQLRETYLLKIGMGLLLSCIAIFALWFKVVNGHPLMKTLLIAMMLSGFSMARSAYSNWKKPIKDINKDTKFKSQNLRKFYSR